MKTIIYIVTLCAACCLPPASFSQHKSKSDPQSASAPEKTSDSTRYRIFGSALKSMRPALRYIMRMPVLRDKGNSRILIAKLDSVHPYRYNMPIKKMEMAD